ncbi:MAG: family 78 glycoside hydrolase catalytic domain [Clostridia bacterium]|nr:family 78 glycoside hydrolase catalytic domain [Clostridia bacterium]
MSIYTAKWVRDRADSESPLFRKHFTAKNIKKATVDICGLGWFELYINGKPATDAIFEPATSNYSQLAGRRFGYYEFNDRFVATRVYFCRYDITDLVTDGENLLSAHLGNGWFNQHTLNIAEGEFYNGYPRLIFSVSLEDREGNVTEIDSDTSVRAGATHVLFNNIYDGEYQDLELLADFHSPDFDDSLLGGTMEAEAPDGELTLYEFPRDRVIREIKPRLLGQIGKKFIYDVGENITGRIIFDTRYDKKITLEHAEELNADGDLDLVTLGGPRHVQRCVYIGDGRHHKDLHPHFSWQGFRYFSVVGEIENPVCQVIHTDLDRSGDFVCDNEIINTVFDMYLRTQMNNIHGCIPSDCPHIERKGYTGDGQVTCETVMHAFDGRQFYRKWMRDIADCQCADNGHVQNTAPFVGGGGGPGGWGGAAVVIPYTYYKMYGDESFVREYRDCAVHYLEYMESLCEGGIVTQGEPGQWCLGDWCFSGCTEDGEQEQFPNPYVNTCFLARFYGMMLELDEKLGLGIDRQKYTELKKLHSEAITAKYFDPESGDFCGNTNGANAFAVDIGLGDSRTLDNLTAKYDETGCFDTGIFGTELLVRLLGKIGRADIVYKLLTSRVKDHSFYYMHECGSTTLWEWWHGKRSHSHPMFGGCFKALWQVFLGINPEEAGYTRVRITPCDIKELGNMSGYLTTPQGRLSVEFDRKNGVFTLEIPEDTYAEFEFRGTCLTLSSGTHKITV